MKLNDMLSTLPSPLKIERAREELRKRLVESNSRLVVDDDDPTGTQTVHGIRVYMDWTKGMFLQAIASGDPVFYVSTNSRGLTTEQAQSLSLELAENLAGAVAESGVKPLIASRSDSTLRGHFPHEVNALAAGLGLETDGVIICPAFFEAGRYTIGDVHYVEQAGTMVPASETEFAKDPNFGFKNSNLKLWVEEKTRGKVKADQVLSISLDTIRTGGPEAVADALMGCSGSQPVIVNAACYEDIEVFCLGLSEAEAKGKRFVYRCAACFVKVRGGIIDRPLLQDSELNAGSGPGLVVVGSYVDKTTKQLGELLCSGKATGIEVRVDRLLDDEEREAEIAYVCREADMLLSQGTTAAIYTSRQKKDASGEEFLRIGKCVMDALCSIIQSISTKPSFLISKGGITSIETARTALGVEEALVLGQVIDGVPVWRLGSESIWSGIPYIVFPGNVGGEDALLKVVSRLQKME